MAANLEALRDHVRIWRVDPVGHTEALLAVARDAAPTSGLPSVRALADKGESCSRTRLAALVSEVAEEIDLAPATGLQAQDDAVEAMARRLLASEVTPRELTYWVTRVVGLRGGEGSRTFLSLEQEYCDRLGEDVADLDRRVREAAAAFVATAGRPESGSRRTGLLTRFLRRRP